MQVASCVVAVEEEEEEEAVEFVALRAREAGTAEGLRVGAVALSDAQRVGVV